MPSLRKNRNQTVLSLHALASLAGSHIRTLCRPAAAHRCKRGELRARSPAYDTMYAAAPADMICPSGPRNSMRVLATREPRRSTLARSSKWLPMPGRR